MLEDRAGGYEQGLLRMGKTALGDAAGLGVEGTGLEGGVHARKSQQSALVYEAAHITDLRHELRLVDLTRALHGHDHIEFRQRGVFQRQTGRSDSWTLRIICDKRPRKRQEKCPFGCLGWVPKSVLTQGKG